MTYPAPYLLDGPADIWGQMGNLWRGWTPARKRKPFWSINFKEEVLNEVAELVLLAPSLIAEVAPLALFWHSHLPVWEMSGLMAASFAFMWWMTWGAYKAVCSGYGRSWAHGTTPRPAEPVVV